MLHRMLSRFELPIACPRLARPLRLAGLLLAGAVSNLIGQNTVSVPLIPPGQKSPPPNGVAPQNPVPPAAAAPARPQPAPPPAAPGDDPALQVAPANQNYTAKAGETDALFNYKVTNVSSEELIIKDVVTSCGCSVPRLPSKPWKLAPGATGEFQINVDLRGKFGNLVKTATIETEKGVKQLMLQISVPMPPAVSTDPESRARNMQLAAGDRQAVFKGDCIRCHVTPASGQMGVLLYSAACGICHDAVHRNAMVPDLRELPHATNRDFWKSTIVAGKPNTLMPAFSADMGGPLTRAQIDSLADYLTQEFSPRHPAGSASDKPAPAKAH